MNKPTPSSCCPGGRCEIPRRDFLKLSSAAVAAMLSPSAWAAAGPFKVDDFQNLVPADKKLSPDWVKSLFTRGTPTVYRSSELGTIGMPIGGICSGHVYLGGDGTLWHWDIFNRHIGTGADHYAHPLKPTSPFAQGFALSVSAAGKSQTRQLNQSSFREVSFCGEYPIGTVEYRDADAPVSVSLEAYSPFTPLEVDDSSLPATVMSFTIKNTGTEKIDCEIAGWIENAVGLYTAQPGEMERHNRAVQGNGFAFLDCFAGAPPDTGMLKEVRSDIVFEDFEKETYEGWTATGTAFGKGPIERTKAPKYQGDLGGEGQRVVNSHASAEGTELGAKDDATGQLTSREFKIERKFISFYIGGGHNPGKTCLNLVVEDKVVRSATGRDENKMHREQWDVGALQGKIARLVIVDDKQGPWGNIGIDQVVFTDEPIKSEPLPKRHDFGTMGIGLIGAGAKVVTSIPAEHLAEGNFAAGLFSAEGAPGETKMLSGEKLIGGISRKFAIAPGESKTIPFVIAWHFPNLELGSLGKVGRYYATKFENANAVFTYLAANFERLSSQTRLWRDTWLGSTLPHWFLERTFANTSTLATSTVYRFADGRFYSWEGVGCCTGTCTHVWHYAQAMAHIFPQLERNTRERVDLGVGFNQSTGVIGFRAEFDRELAVDGQAGTLLRMYREHQMSPDSAFLKRNWTKIKKAFEPLLALDQASNGVMEGRQMNTLDVPWFGKVAWLSSLYLAAVRAGEAMAREMNENAFAERCQIIAEHGAKNILQLFNGDYFMNQPDPARPDTINSGTGCEIDQVLGQSWAWQVALGRIIPAKETLSALRSLWLYNFTPDVGPYRAAHKPGRWYAMPGEGGLLMCTFPRADWDYKKANGKGPEWAAGYFNECMNGFEYQVASHMVAEGMVMEGLAITRMIHDRYHAARRNPWNEIECGDHYARSMASYGVFVSACGFEHHGPRGHIGFAPRITPERFQAPFTTAEGWGTFSQTIEGGRLNAGISLKFGKLRVLSIALALPEKMGGKAVHVAVNGHETKSAHTLVGTRLTITLPEEAQIAAGQSIAIAVA